MSDDIRYPRFSYMFFSKNDDAQGAESLIVYANKPNEKYKKNNE
jgi:hypothetical protein